MPHHPIPLPDGHSPEELEPWLVFFHSEVESYVALWRIDGTAGEPTHLESLALFSDQESATLYASQTCRPNTTWRVQQLPSLDLIRILISCYTRGVKYAVLNPQEGRAQQVFILRDVLKAARIRLRKLAG
jgi:hypothetical protein